MQSAGFDEVPMFIRARILPGGTWYDLAIADISAIEVPERAGLPVHIIIGGLHAMVNAESYQTLHAAWVSRRRSAVGR